jgi:hypothetical protein
MQKGKSEIQTREAYQTSKSSEYASERRDQLSRGMYSLFIRPVSKLQESNYSKTLSAECLYTPSLQRYSKRTASIQRFLSVQIRWRSVGTSTPFRLNLIPFVSNELSTMRVFSTINHHTNGVVIFIDSLENANSVVW